MRACMSPYRLTHAVRHAPLDVHGHRMLLSACNPMACPNSRLQVVAGYETVLVAADQPVEMIATFVAAKINKVSRV